MVFDKIYGIYGSADLTSSVAGQEIAPDIRTLYGYTFQPIFSHLTIRVFANCHISINGGDYMYIDVTTGGLNIKDFDITSVRIMESGINFHYVIGW